MDDVDEDMNLDVDMNMDMVISSPAYPPVKDVDGPIVKVQ